MSSIQCDLDFDSKGKRFGSLNLTHSDNEHSFAIIPIPLGVIVGDPGPTVLLTAGNHGDEYEGQVILRRLLHELQPEQITGRLIILPALNYPAMRDNARVSPLDGGNLNRSFPGREGATPTEAIAHFVTTKILPICDAGVDFHSGGRPANYVPCAFLCTSGDRRILEKSLAMIDAFGAPFTYVMRGEDAAAGFDPAAHDSGVPFISTELSGGAGVDVDATQIGRDGLYNVLENLGVLTDAVSKAPQTIFLNGNAGGHVLSSPVTGIFEPTCRVGGTVRAGEPAGHVYSLDEIDRAPIEMVFEAPGRIMVLRTTARVIPGSHLTMVVPEMTRGDIFAIAGGAP